jgi:hypothetical protein
LTPLVNFEKITRVVFQENLESRNRFYPLPLEGATPGGGDYFSVILKYYHPPPNPLPSREGGIRGKIN